MNAQCQASWKRHQRILTPLMWAQNNIRNRQSVSKRSTRLFVPLPRVISRGSSTEASAVAAGAMVRCSHLDAGIEINGSLEDLFMYRRAFTLNPESPPTIHSTPTLESSLKQWGPNSRVRKGYERIKATIRAGQQLGTPPLSKNWRALDRQPDMLLQYWGIHHLYLDKKLKNKVLLTHVDLPAQNVTFLDIRDKPTRTGGWFDRSIIELLVSHCPEGNWIEVRGIDGLEVDYADCEIFHLQNAGLIPIFALNNKFIMANPLFLRGQAILNRMARSKNPD